MIVELGNPAPQELVDGRPARLAHGQPCVTTLRIDDSSYTHEEGQDATRLMRHMNSHQDITRLSSNEAFVAVVRTWQVHGALAPTWVYSDNADMQRLLSEYWGIPEGHPADLELTHHTRNGPPGAGTNIEIEGNTVGDPEVQP